MQATRHRCAGNRRTFLLRTLGKSASKQNAAGSASTRLGAVAMNALLCVQNVARPDTYKLATSATRRITICTNVSARRAGRGRGPVPADLPPPRNPSQLQKKTAKDLENQLEKARLEGVREGLEKREASLSSTQSSSKRGGGRGRGRGKGKGGQQQGKGKTATDSTPTKEKD